VFAKLQVIHYPLEASTQWTESRRHLNLGLAGLAGGVHGEGDNDISRLSPTPHMGAEALVEASIGGVKHRQQLAGI
tara:strand:- start:87 stop:314 length:228 start_codon:yes stop_codon:yes gene_type:complete